MNWGEQAINFIAICTLCGGLAVFERVAAYGPVATLAWTCLLAVAFVFSGGGDRAS